MAKRRMLSIEVIESDKFCSLPASSQMLYMHLNLNADDDGFVGNVNNLRRLLGVEKKYFRLLIERNYIIEFKTGVIAIIDWHVHNRVRADRYVRTRYIEELSQVKLGRNDRYEKL